MPLADMDNEPPPASRPFPVNHVLLFKKRKVLPHPRKDAPYAALRGTHLPLDHDATMPSLSASLAASAFSDDVPTTNLHTPNPHTLRHYPKQLGSGPDLPPTPPAHSRNSSATYSALPLSATYVQSPESSAEGMQMKAPKPLLPATPTKQMNPPTPDVTPPQPVQRESRPKCPLPRSHPPARNLSKGASDCRTASFRTARENFSTSSSDDEDLRFSSRPAMATARLAENTSPRNTMSIEESSAKRLPKAIGLGLGLELSPNESITPPSNRHEFSSFDGEWGSEHQPDTPEWNGDLGRDIIARSLSVSSRQNTSAPLPFGNSETTKDTTLLPTNATEALRAMPLPHRILTFPLPNSSTQSASTKRRQRQQIQQQQHLPLASAAPIFAHMVALSDSSTSDRDRGKRVSITSSKSTASTAIEAFAPGTPVQRQKTLRHVKKRDVLRDASCDASPTSSAPTSLSLDEPSNQRRVHTNLFNGNGRESVLSTATCNSISSRSARRELWKAGAIPVVIIPGRASSTRSTSRETSLRSASSQRTRRSQSVHSTPLSQLPKSRDYSPNPDQRSQGSQRSKTYSEPDGSAPGDQRTIDFPPIVPRRTSSLSAPTSRNASRRGSMTAESVQAYPSILKSRLEDAMSHTSSEYHSESTREAIAENATIAVEQKEEDPTQTPSRERELPGSAYNEVRIGQVTLVEPASIAQEPVKDGLEFHEAPGADLDRNQDGRGGIYLDTITVFDPRVEQRSTKHLSSHNTPFSLASIETTTTHHSQAEVAQALAVNIYPHQNTSVLMVDHSNRPSECSDDSQRDRSRELDVDNIQCNGCLPELALPPSRQAAGPDCVSANDAPVTPPRRDFSLDDVDSPLRNPRAPPAPPVYSGPPAINFIPATPSGLTTSTETRDQSECFNDNNTGKPRRRRTVSAVLQRALSRGRGQGREYGPSSSRTKGLITRTMSLTRGGPRRSLSLRRADSLDRRDGVSFEVGPAEEGRLHPSWRPASFYASDDRALMHYDDTTEAVEETYRYPPVDNRPQALQRSVSDRVKRTFAILPLDDDKYDLTMDQNGPERRTVRRTPSGNLRVVKYRRSLESFRKEATYPAFRPSTAPGGKVRRLMFWRSPLLKETRPQTSARDVGKSAAGDKIMSILPNIGDKIGEYGPHTILRRLSERRREKRSNELRQKISAPREVRDGVGDVIRRTTYRDAFTQAHVCSEI